MKKIFFLARIILLLGGIYASFTPETNAATVTPTLVAGNPTCADLGYLYELKVDPPTAGTYTMGNGTFTWTTTDNKHVDRTSTMAVDAVIVKGGNGANVYAYNPESKGDTDLVSPNNNGGQISDISHLSICYDYEVETSKTANTSFTRQHLRTIEKTVNPTELTLAIGQIGTANYLIKVNSPSYVDKDWLVAGNISIYNPDPQYPAIINSISDVMDTESITLDCGIISFPYTLNVGQTLNCTYQKSLPGPVNTINTATVITDAASKVGGSVATAAVTFGSPTTVLDDEVSITDTMYTPSTPRTCSIAGTLPCEFTYTYNVGPFTQIQADFEINNIATVIATDSQTSASANAKLLVHMLPPAGGGNDQGCTYTQGYRKTHSTYGPAKKADPTRAVLGGADTLFYLTTKSRYTVFQTPPKGNIYYILAHQFMAAKLNKLSGAASTPAVDAAMAYAETFFSTYTPTTALSLSKTIKAYATVSATLLDQYNNGLIGPGHCE